MANLAIAADHGGFQLKAALCRALSGWGIEFEDLGTDSEAACDYPDFAHKLAEGIQSGRFSRGILLCGTGIGMSMAANKHPGVRAAAVSDTFSAQASRQHNHSNVLCMGGRVVGEGLAIMILKAWLDAEPSHDERHARRLGKLEIPRS